MNPLLLTLTGDDPGTMAGKKKKPVNKNTWLRKAVRAAAYLTPAAAPLAIIAINKRNKKIAAQKKAAAAKKQAEAARQKQAAATATATANPTPENTAAAQTATIQAAATTATAQKAEREEAIAEEQAPETEEGTEETTEENEEDAAQESIDTAGAIPAAPKKIKTVQNPALIWLKNNKQPAIVLGCALAYGIFASIKKK